jgi:hypothetical protein
VSFNSRERRRRRKLEDKKATAGARRNRAPETARRWFLTLARTGGRCACCDGRFVKGAEIVYRHEPRETRCVRCASRLEDSKGFRPSIRWERANRVPKAA